MSPMPRSLLPACFVARLSKKFGYECVVMIGDGATDMQVRVPAAREAHYDEVVRTKSDDDDFYT